MRSLPRLVPVMVLPLVTMLAACGEEEERFAPAIPITIAVQTAALSRWAEHRIESGLSRCYRS